MKNRPSHPSSAFSLIEVTLALGIASFCLLSVFGLLPLGLSNSQNAAEQTAVGGIATSISADLHSIATLGTTGTTSSTYGITIPSPGSAVANSQPVALFFTADGNLCAAPGQAATSGTGGAPRYRATISFYPDPTLVGVNPKTTLYKAWIFITWPALADSNPTIPPANFSGSYEYMTALNFSPN